MGVKSPFFRRWFGDWRAEDKSTVKVLDIKPGEINTKTRSITNNDISRKIKIESQVFNDSIYYARRHKDEKAVKSLLSNIDSIIANSVLLNSEVSEKNKGSKKGNTLLMHHFYIGVEYNKAPFIAELIVEEYLDNFNDLKSRVYNVQRIKMSDLPRGHYGVLNNTSKAEKLRLQSDEITISDLFSFVKTYDKDFNPKPCSLVLNDDGTPKEVYHGTSSGGFSIFDTYAYHGKYGLFGNGAYFTESLRVAKQYTSKGKGKSRQIYSVYLSIKNPIDMDKKADIIAWEKAVENEDLYTSFYDGMTNEEAFREVEEALAAEMIPKYEAEEIVRDIFERMEYDGITHMGGGRVNTNGIRHRVWIAFEPNQIKSTDNFGMFSQWDDDIYLSKESLTDDSNDDNIKSSKGGRTYGQTTNNGGGAGRVSAEFGNKRGRNSSGERGSFGSVRQVSLYEDPEKQTEIPSRNTSQDSARGSEASLDDHSKNPLGMGREGKSGSDDYDRRFAEALSNNIESLARDLLDEQATKKRICPYNSVSR